MERWTTVDGTATLRVEPWGLVHRAPDGSEIPIVGRDVDDVEHVGGAVRVRCGEDVFDLDGYDTAAADRITELLLTRRWGDPPPAVAAEEERRARLHRHLPAAVRATVAVAVTVLLVWAALTVVGVLAPDPTTSTSEPPSTPAVADRTECAALVQRWNAAAGDEGAANRIRDEYVDRGCDVTCAPLPSTPGIGPTDICDLTAG